MATLFRRIYRIGVLAAVFAGTPVSSDATDFNRELSPDRPDMTESPFTVEKGRVQFEVDLANISHYKEETSTGETLRLVSLGTSINAKLGIHERADLQLVVGLERHKVDENSWASGLSDPMLRLKVNVIGNDGGTLGFGLMPYLVAPFGSAAVSADEWQGGIIIAAAYDVDGYGGIGVMHEFARAAAPKQSHDWDYVASVAISRDVTPQVGSYLEFFQSIGLQGHQTWVPFLGGGLTYAVSENVLLDAGVNFGLNRHAEDINPFAGITFRM